MADIVWPRALLVARSNRWTVAGAAVESGRPAIGSTPQRSVFGGGGLVMARLRNIQIRTREQLAAWRSIDLRCDNGAAPLVLACLDGLARPTVKGVAVTAAASTAAAYRAVRLSISVSGARPFAGDEAFSILTASGWRWHRICNIRSAVSVSGGMVYDVDIRPPLRAALAAGAAIEFANPRCEMRLAEASGLDAEVDLRRFADVSVSFVEDLASLDVAP